MKLPGSWPVTCSHWSIEMPCAWNCCTVFCTRACRSPWTIASGGSMSTSPASDDVDALDELVAGLVELAVAEALGERAAPLLDGVELAEVLARPTRR